MTVNITIEIDAIEGVKKIIINSDNVEEAREASRKLQDELGVLKKKEANDGK